MPWNHMQVEIIRDDQMIFAFIGPGGMSREEARHVVQQILDRAVEKNPALARAAAETWRRGVEQHSVHAGPFEWKIYEHPEGEEPHQAAYALFEGSPLVTDWDAGGEDFFLNIRDASGIDTQLAQLPAADAPEG